jgi:hypothetical protein
MTGAAIAIGIANIVTSAVSRRSRTRRRLVDPPLIRAADGSLGRAWSGMEWLPVRCVCGSTVIVPRRRAAKELGGTARAGTYGSKRSGWQSPKIGNVFVLYAVLAGLALGLVTGGSAVRLGNLRLRWGPLIALGMVVQLLLFSSPLGNALGDGAALAYLASNVVVLVAVAANLALRGLPLVLAGGVSNFAAIVANGGYMPVSEDALAAAGNVPMAGYSNSVPRDEAVLAPLTDLFSMPSWIPMANVFSVGDILIGAGVAIAVVAAMHGRGPLIAPQSGAVAH